jgi:hypothetical protein
VPKNKEKGFHYSFVFRHYSTKSKMKNDFGVRLRLRREVLCVSYLIFLLLFSYADLYGPVFSCYSVG